MKKDESEETEVKKDIEWLKKRFDEVVEFRKQSNPSTSWGLGSNAVLKCIKEDFKNLINKLAEQEVLSQEWIDENKSLINGRSTNPDGTEGECYDAHYIHVLELQNLLAPKQEEVDRAYKDGYEEGRERGFYKGYREGLGNKGGEPETVSDVVADFYKSCERLQGVMSMEVEEWEE